MSKGILLDDNDDLQISVRRDSTGKIVSGLVVDSRKMQDAYIVLSVSQGEIKEDPLCGANLRRMMRGRENREKIRKTIEIALARVGIDVDDIKKQIDIIINKVSI